jgi:peptide/nickel transport system substrate-binding protein
VRPGGFARIALGLLLACLAAAAAGYVETPMFAADVAAGKLPTVAERLPRTPRVMRLEGAAVPGRHGGTLNTLIGRSRDVRLLVVYGYARLVGYNRKLEIVPDILQSFEVENDRRFTFHLRPGHRWSDGVPFTAEDFRYYWEDVANNRELSPSGPPRDLLVDGEPPSFEILDPTTVRYTWSKPNPDFLPALAGASPLFIYRPAHYLRRFHIKYSKKIAAAQASGGVKHQWARKHNRLDNMYRFDNPDLPTLQPWVNTTRPPADRFVAVRNPYFHRVDAEGRQLPYIDKVTMAVVDSKLIATKAGAGEADLQARELQFANYTFLKQHEKANGYRTLLWRTGTGSQFALYPNLNTNDPVWRRLLRDVRFRRALSLAIDRSLVNQVIYFGLGTEANNTVLPESPLFRERYQTLWAHYDRKAANRLLDALGLKRRRDGVRRLPDGRRLEIIVETAGEGTEQSDILELIRETWREVGIRVFTKPTQRENFRQRVFSGETIMAAWGGLDNGIPTADMVPDMLAPTSQQQLQWPKFGQYYETSGKAGEPVDMPEVKELARLLKSWYDARDHEARERIWHRMLELHAEQQFVIGVVNQVPQPVVARSTLANVPERGIYNWNPGAFFGIYHPDTFWYK